MTRARVVGSITRVVATALALAGVVVVAAAPPAASAACGTGARLNATQLNSLFANPGLGTRPGVQGFGGGDYPHAYSLPDGRVLWLFQDLYFSDDNNLNEPLNNAAHNAGVLQDGDCFTVLGNRGLDVIGDSETIDSRRWFWPMDGEIGFDGKLWIFMVEMSNYTGNGATTHALPVRSWLAILDPVTLEQEYFAPAPASSSKLFGWSVVSAGDYSYLYGHCYRQFAHDVNGPGQFDSTCMPSTYLARVPLGHFDVEPEYWNGTGWSTSELSAVPVLTRSAANPMSVQFFGDVFVSVTKIDDWWGDKIYIDRAPAPQGPWTTVQTINVVNDRKCSNGCGNYGAFLLPWLDSAGKMTIALSNGGEFALWLANGWLYRPTFYTANVPAPLNGQSAASPPAFTAAPGTAGFMPVDPRRLVDTREPAQAFGRLRAGSVSTLDLGPVVGVPSGASAVALNLTTVNAAQNGWVRAYPCAGAEPATSNVNQIVGTAQSNAVIVPVGDGRICFRTLTEVDIVVDLNGWLTTSSEIGLQPVAARRLVDSRIGLGAAARLTAGQMIEVPVAETGNAPAAVALNITAVDPAAAGFVTAWPCGVARPVVSNLNPEPGVTQPNFVNVRVGAGGKVCLYTSQDTDLVVDLQAEYRTGATARYASLPPQRLFDSRFQNDLHHASNNAYLIATGDIVAAQVNLTATDANRAGYLTAYPCLSQQWPGTSNVNFVTALASANSALLTGSRGYGCVYSSTASQLVVDLFGLWTVPA